jgi:hypothetical protein
MNVPSGTEKISDVLELLVRGVMKFGQETMQQLSAGHSGGGLLRPGQVYVDDFCHYLLVFD